MSRTHLPGLLAYIEGQEEHHRRESFAGEYKRLLTQLGIEHDERFLFKPPQ